jgi:Family of unknown function (DUF5994)
VSSLIRRIWLIAGQERSVVMTPHQSRRNNPDSTLPAHTPRLRLKPKAPPRGSVDGAWWPHSGDLVAELPDLLAVLSVRLGRIERVLYNVEEWAQPPRKLLTGGRAVRLDGYRLQPPDTVEVLGLDHDRLILRVVAPGTQADAAHTAMMAVAQPGDASDDAGSPEPAVPAPALTV